MNMGGCMPRHGKGRGVATLPTSYRETVTLRNTKGQSQCPVTAHSLCVGTVQDARVT